MDKLVIHGIKDLIEELRVYLKRDGGDVEFVKYEDNIVHVNVTGACSSCNSLETTLKYLVEDTIKEKFPEVKEVRQADDLDLWKDLM